MTGPWQHTPSEVPITQATTVAVAVAAAPTTIGSEATASATAASVIMAIPGHAAAATPAAALSAPVPIAYAADAPTPMAAVENAASNILGGTALFVQQGLKRIRQGMRGQAEHGVDTSEMEHQRRKRIRRHAAGDQPATSGTENDPGLDATAVGSGSAASLLRV